MTLVMGQSASCASLIPVGRLQAASANKVPGVPGAPAP